MSRDWMSGVWVGIIIGSGAGMFIGIGFMWWQAVR